MSLFGFERPQSPLEFELRLQEYIELARAEKTYEALAYWRKHLQLWQDTHLARIQQATGLIAFRPNTKCKSYKVRFNFGLSPLASFQPPFSAYTAQTDGATLSNASKAPSFNFTPFRRHLYYTMLSQQDSQH